MVGGRKRAKLEATWHQPTFTCLIDGLLIGAIGLVKISVAGRPRRTIRRAEKAKAAEMMRKRGDLQAQIATQMW
jgi:hypothetical protein